MTKYPKIQSLFKRDDASQFTDEFTRSEFEYLHRNFWIGTEKVDGTNIRVGWLGGIATIAGRTDKAQLSPALVEYMFSVMTTEVLTELFGKSDNHEVILFGEGYGAGIQKGGGKYRNDQGFILFDVLVNGMWLYRSAVEDIATKLGVPVTPVVFHDDLPAAIDMVKAGFTSLVAAQERNAEGLVLVPEVPLLDRRGERIITKLKEKDFR